MVRENPMPRGRRRPYSRSVNERRTRGQSLDFEKAPLLVIWEMTRACELACRHCRASAINQRHPDELTTGEALRLIEDVAELGVPLLVFSGGDPLQRLDLEELVAFARAWGLKTATIPAATARLTRARIRQLKAAGIQQLALSVDGSDSDRHDRLRGVPGSFVRTLMGAAWIRDEEVPLQINTVVSDHNASDLDAIADLVEALGVVFWEVFFLVPVGRGAELTACSPETMLKVFDQLYERSRAARFTIKVTEAPMFRRYVHERRQVDPVAAPSRGRTSAWPVNAGRGFCFVNHVGDVYPSGFLPVSAGNVREVPIGPIYRYSHLFRELRNDALLKGRCGRCHYRRTCGGSRSRAFALTGDYLAEDPACPFPDPGRPGALRAAASLEFPAASDSDWMSPPPEGSWD
jgi:radical SAM protein